MIKALIFDLDDTLYREKDFLESGYRAVARHMSVRFGSDFEKLYSTMIETLNTSGRQAVMTAVREENRDSSVSIKELVAIYRNHIPEIELPPGYLDILKGLSQRYRLGIITDGNPEVQAGKVRALGLDALMDKIIYTWEYGPEKQKPHPQSFSHMLRSLQTEAQSTLYIGDNPFKDCIGAHSAGMKFILLRPMDTLPEFTQTTEENNPEYIINTLFQLHAILQELN